MRAIIFVAAAMLAGCGSEPETTDLTDAEAIGMVEKSQKIPAAGISPEPITSGDIEAEDAFGFSCAFASETARDEILALAMREGGFLKERGQMLRFAADKGSGETEAGSWRNYDGTAFSFTLELEGEGQSSGTETTRYPASLSVRDANGEVAYSAAGSAECGV